MNWTADFRVCVELLKGSQASNPSADDLIPKVVLLQLITT